LFRLSQWSFDRQGRTLSHGNFRFSRKNQIGVFVVSGPANHVDQVLDFFPLREVSGFPSIGAARPDSVSLHFYSDYGIYEGGLKYFYELSGGKPALKIRFGKLGLRSSEVRNRGLIYTVSELDKIGQIAIEPGRDGSLPSFAVTKVPVPAYPESPEPRPMRLPDGRSAVIKDKIAVSISGTSGRNESHVVPVPTIELYRRLRPSDPAPGEIQNGIGPHLLEGPLIWFANNFYDGEGTSGVGAIGSFDSRTNQFKMRYLPEIVRWSGSAIRLDGDDIWVGLMRQPEGSAYSGGLLRYNRITGAVMTWRVPDYIYTIDRVGDAIYCGTSEGLYILRAGAITHLRFEPDRDGKLTMIAGS
jgi:hypothetical protein